MISLPNYFDKCLKLNIFIFIEVFTIPGVSKKKVIIWFKVRTIWWTWKNFPTKLEKLFPNDHRCLWHCHGRIQHLCHVIFALQYFSSWKMIFIYFSAWFSFESRDIGFAGKQRFSFALRLDWFDVTVDSFIRPKINTHSFSHRHSGLPRSKKLQRQIGETWTSILKVYLILHATFRKVSRNSSQK